MIPRYQIPWYAALGYGCDPNGKIIPEYAYFITKVVNEYRFTANTLTGLVIAGGKTDPNRFWGISEAEMMEKVIDHVADRHFIIYHENESVTTIQNIRNLKKLKIEHEIENRDTNPYSKTIITLYPYPLGIICDKNRAFKVDYITRKIFKTEIPIIGFDFGRTIKEKALILAGTIKDIAAINCLPLEQYFLQQREREIGII